MGFLVALFFLTVSLGNAFILAKKSLMNFRATHLPSTTIETPLLEQIVVPLERRFLSRQNLP